MDNRSSGVPVGAPECGTGDNHLHDPGGLIEEAGKDERDKHNIRRSAGQEGQAHPAQKTPGGQQARGLDHCGVVDRSWIRPRIHCSKRSLFRGGNDVGGEKS